MMDDRHKIAALVHLSHTRDIEVPIGPMLPPAIWKHLEERGFVWSPAGWPITHFIATREGKEWLQAALR
jgi:hypothetical protein